MVEDLDKKTFIDNIFDYESNEVWKYQGQIPCLIDFWAPWCGPCKVVSPTIEQLSEEYKEQVLFYKINTDEQSELAAAFDIKSIPSLLFIPMIGQPKMAIGAHPKEVIKQAIELELLGRSAPNLN